MKKGMNIHAPSKAGHWKLRMLTVGSTGLKITDTLDIKVTSTLEVDVRTPVEINVGETVQTDIYVANNVNSCMDVRYKSYIYIRIMNIILWSYYFDKIMNSINKNKTVSCR